MVQKCKNGRGTVCDLGTQLCTVDRGVHNDTCTQAGKYHSRERWPRHLNVANAVLTTLALRMPSNLFLYNAEVMSGMPGATSPRHSAESCVNRIFCFHFAPADMRWNRYSLQAQVATATKPQILSTPQVVFPLLANVFHNNVLIWTARTFVPDTKIARRKYGNFRAVGRAWIILKIKLLRIEHRLG